MEMKLWKERMSLTGRHGVLVRIVDDRRAASSREMAKDQVGLIKLLIQIQRPTALLKQRLRSCSCKRRKRGVAGQRESRLVFTVRGKVDQVGEAVESTHQGHTGRLRTVWL
jgi:hypothetical protein